MKGVVEEANKPDKVDCERMMLNAAEGVKVLVRTRNNPKFDFCSPMVANAPTATVKMVRRRHLNIEHTLREPARAGTTIIDVDGAV